MAMPREGKFKDAIQDRIGATVDTFDLEKQLSVLNANLHQAETINQVVAGPFLGLVQFRLVHNTGAAWGMFDESTFALGVMSVLVCVALTVYLFTAGKRAGVMETVGIALIVAGGLGNALDRFTLGYVVDFIDTVFISFPTFNVADIGVTCGFVLFFAGMLWSMRKDAPAKEVASEEK